MDNKLIKSLLLVIDEMSDDGKNFMITDPRQHNLLANFTMETINHHLELLLNDGMFQGQLGPVDTIRKCRFARRFFANQGADDDACPKAR